MATARRKVTSWKRYRSDSHRKPQQTTSIPLGNVWYDAEGHVYLEKKGNLLIEVDIIEPMGLMTTVDMERAHAEFLKRKRKYDAFLRRVQKFEVTG